jgi:predicted cupin superfamily sugar epimerase
MSSELTAQEVIDRLQLVPLPIEGGYFRETYRSPLRHLGHALPAKYGGERHASTAIYHLLTPGTFSAIHRVKSDEVFHFYAGDPVEMLQLGPDGDAAVVLIGNDLAGGHEPQIVVPAGVWQGCRLVPGGRWAVMGCTVAPGFDDADFEAASRAALVRDYPAHAEMIAVLTPR